MDDDEQLHDGIVLLDRAALTAWQERYAPAIIAWLQRGGLSLADAEEVWNDVFSATVAAAPRLSPRGVSLRRYAFRVARNIRVDRLAESRRLQTVPIDENVGLRTADASPPNPARVEALRECLGSAPDRYRLVVELTDQGDGVAELAAQFHVQPESVHQLRRRARHWLARCLEGKLQ
jgi:RNA polymerase sigma factor (sigma-70 family)